MKYYKCLTEDHCGFYSAEKWPPIGVWTSWKPIKICRSGYHVCKAEDLIHWLDAKIFEVEVQNVQDFKLKSIACRARLGKQLKWNARQYAADCVEHLGILSEYVKMVRDEVLSLPEFMLGTEYNIAYGLMQDNAFIGAHSVAFYCRLKGQRIEDQTKMLFRRLNENIC